jgi:hypothetical protein
VALGIVWGQRHFSRQPTYCVCSIPLFVKAVAGWYTHLLMDSMAPQWCNRTLSGRELDVVKLQSVDHKQRKSTKQEEMKMKKYRKWKRGKLPSVSRRWLHNFRQVGGTVNNSWPSTLSKHEFLPCDLDYTQVVHVHKIILYLEVREVLKVNLS